MGSRWSTWAPVQPWSSLCAVSGEAVSSVELDRGPRLLIQSQHQRLQTAAEWHGVHHETFVHVPGFFFFGQSFVFFFASLHWTVVVHRHHVLFFFLYLYAPPDMIYVSVWHICSRCNIFVYIILFVAELAWVFKIGSSLGGVTPWEGYVASSARGLIDFLMISGQAPSPW